MKTRSLHNLKRSDGLMVVIPCFKVSRQILTTINRIGSNVDRIIVVDDACPESTGKIVSEYCRDKRVVVISHQINLGVGGAVKTGYRYALAHHANIIVKLDGDGQMDPESIDKLVLPIIQGRADYSKGNRFFSIEGLSQMPRLRLLGNLVLSFMTKFSSGYWKVFDPTNGFTAVDARTLLELPLDKVDNRYFFESDMLFRLGLIGARVKDVPIKAIYNDEKSNLKITRVIFEFPAKHFRNFTKRVIYSYYLRDLNLASIELPLGLLLVFCGSFIGLSNFINNYSNGAATPPGTLTLFSVLILMGIQLILAFFNHDIAVREN